MKTEQGHGCRVTTVWTVSGQNILLRRVGPAVSHHCILLHHLNIVVSGLSVPRRHFDGGDTVTVAQRGRNCPAARTEGAGESDHCRFAMLVRAYCAYQTEDGHSDTLNADANHHRPCLRPPRISRGPRLVHGWVVEDVAPSIHGAAATRCVGTRSSVGTHECNHHGRCEDRTADRSWYVKKKSDGYGKRVWVWTGSGAA